MPENKDEKIEATPVVESKDTAVEAKASADAAPSESVDEVNAGDGGEGNDGGGEEPQYTPSFKYKALDEEKEIDEYFRQFIKTKEDEDKFKEVFSKAGGLDLVKGKFEKEKATRQELESNYQGIVQELQELGTLRKQDLGLFLERIQLPEEEVAKWLLTRLEAKEKLKDLPPALQQMYTEHDKLKRENFELRKTNEGLSGSHVDASVQARTMELSSKLSQPEVQPLIQAFEARVNRPGAFAEMVIRHGRAEWELNKKDLTVEQAVGEVINLLGLAQGGSQPPKPNEPATKVVTQSKPTVIPNVGAGSSASAVPRPRSLDDLRKLAREANAG